MAEKIWTELQKPLLTFGVEPKGKPVFKKVNGQSKQVGTVAYIDARDVMIILNAVVPGRWHDHYPPELVRQDEQGNIFAVCQLTIDGVTREDVGFAAYNILGGTPNVAKAAFSDALKRAAVKFGIGVELYKGEVHDYDGYGMPAIEEEDQRHWTETERGDKFIAWAIGQGINPSGILDALGGICELTEFAGTPTEAQHAIETYIREMGGTPSLLHDTYDCTCGIPDGEGCTCGAVPPLGVLSIGADSPK
jgi:hypothetical protein